MLLARLMKPLNALIALIVAVITVTAPAESSNQKLRFARVFGNGMVLQREKPVKIWGWTTPGKIVEVSAGAGKVTVNADAQGKWMATLKPLATGQPYTIVAKSDGQQTE